MCAILLVDVANNIGIRMVNRRKERRIILDYRHFMILLDRLRSSLLENNFPFKENYERKNNNSPRV